jgi:glycosidase
MRKFFRLTALVLPLFIFAAVSCDSEKTESYKKQTLRVYATPGSETVSSSGPITVTFKLEGASAAAAAFYTTDGSDPSASATAFSSNDTVMITPSTSTTKLKLYVKDGDAVVTNEYWYTSGTLTPEDSSFNNLRMYQVMVESFQNGDSSADYNAGYGPSNYKGDIQGITNALDYIKGLNVNAIWLTPVFNSESIDIKLRGTGYFADDYYNVDPHFGTNEKLRTMINEAHKRGIYVFLDGVFGHHGVADIEGVTDGSNNGTGLKALYPGSLEFFKDVALYWIDNYEIDGWRLDQAYQLSRGYSHNYWQDIREAVEAACAVRKTAGCQWGTLGYMVGEVWDSSENIITDGFGTSSEKGLLSCFDFPTRYRLVQVLATQEDSESLTAKGQAAGSLFDYISVFPSFSYPNLMLTNHDLVRFGNLITRAGYAGTSDSTYWNRHKAAISFMAAYTGPITLYYGDEIGEYLEKYSISGDLGVYDDNMARSNGNIDVTSFSANQKDLHDYAAALMKLKKDHPALWRGATTQLIGDDAIFADLKHDSTANEEIVYILNASTSSQTASFTVAGKTTLTRLPVVSSESATVYTGSSSSFTIPVDPLSGSFYLVQ